MPLGPIDCDANIVGDGKVTACFGNAQVVAVL